MTLGYLAAFGLALIFTFYLDGSIGVMMIAFLIFMPLISFLMTFLVRKKIRLEFVLPDSAAKNKQVSVRIKLKKDTKLPIPFLRMQFHADAHFDPLNPNAADLPEEPPFSTTDAALRRAYRKWTAYREKQLLRDTLPLCLSMGTAKKAQYEIALTPKYCGVGVLALKGIVLSDYLGMFKFRIKPEINGNLLIMPTIPELKANTSMFRAVTTAVNAADEETDSTPVFSASAVPGYEHRDYIPGDSLKRINWKLSSKRHHLMVRKDEPVSLARLSVVLDFRRSKIRMKPELRFSMEEELIETALGFLMLCAKNGYPCNLCYADSNQQWSDLSIDSGEQLAVEAVTLLQGGFREEEELAALSVLPPELMQDAGAVLLYFTQNPSTETVAALEQRPTELYLVAPQQLQRSAGNIPVPKNGSLWYANADHSLTQAQ
ncbi:MAG: DUF58 domain-containing protein [Oscillospiraceae bacterium]|nr:DUF58 domain-containing protein [Oscillospiraceae bacterium]